MTAKLARAAGADDSILYIWVSAEEYADLVDAVDHAYTVEIALEASARMQRTPLMTVWPNL